MKPEDVLLIYPAYSYPRKSPPLGLAYLAAYIRESGFRPHIIDFNTRGLNDVEFRKLLRSREWLLIGISFMTNQFGEAARLALLIKETVPGVPLVAGGPHPSSIPERTLREIDSIDIIARGEGEETLRELASTMQSGGDIGTVHGICFRNGEGIIRTPDREFIADLDRVQFPAWEYFDMNQYNVFHIHGDGGSPAFALLSSRGCPNFCIFCDSHAVFARKFRARSAQNIFDEVMYLNRTYGMLNFDFVDDLFTVQKARVLDFCRLIKASRIPFHWMANARVNTVDLEMLQVMKDSGCARVDFGVETGDPEVRKLMRKNISDEQIRQAHLNARKVGLSTGSFTMVGNLGETKKSARMTVRLLQEFADDVMVSIACPFPGTELYSLAKEKGFLNTEDWTKYVTSPTYEPSYAPVMRSENLSEKEILESFYYIHSFFVRRKFRERFGSFFILNPRFYLEWVFKSEGFRHRVGMFIALFAARFKKAFLITRYLDIH